MVGFVKRPLYLIDVPVILFYCGFWCITIYICCILRCCDFEQTLL